LEYANDGLSYQRPWRTHKGKFLAPGDVVTFPQSDKYVQVGTVTVTTNSWTIQTSTNLSGTLKQYDIFSIGTDNVLYSVNTITSSTITLWRPYRGTSAAGVQLYKHRGVLLTDWRDWNSGAWKGYPDSLVRIECGVNRSSGLQEGWSVYDYQGNDPLNPSHPYFYYSRYAGYNSSGAGSFTSYGCLYGDMYFGQNNYVDFSGVQSTWDRIVCEAQAYFNCSAVADCVINDMEMFSNHANNLYFSNMKNVIFNRFKTGNSINAIYFSGPSIRDVIFYNPTFSEGVDHTRLIYFGSTATYFIENIVFINAKLNIATPVYTIVSTTSLMTGELSFEHYNQTKDDNRTYLFNGSPTGSHAGIMYRDTFTFKSSAPSARIDLVGAGGLPVIRKFLVPAATGIATTVSCYVRFNTAYMSNYYSLPKMVIRTISGTIPNYIWVDTIVTSPATADTWHLLTQTVDPSINNVLEVFLYFQSIGSGAQCWFDEIDVVVPE
jgi:hypothetical protein